MHTKRRAICRLGGIALAALGGLGCSSFRSEVEAPNHDIEIVAHDIFLADGLAIHPTGALLVTEEYRGGGLLRLDPVSGVGAYVHRDLASPDNVLVVGMDVYLTEEDDQGRIVKIDNLGRVTTFASGLRHPEGLDVGLDGKLYVAEHWPSGHVYRYALDGTRETFGDVSNGEGLRVLPDGSVIVAETAANRVSRLFPDGRKTTVAEGTLTLPDGVRYDAVGQRLLVTEDTAPGRLLQVDLDTGALFTIASGLNKPQTMVVEGDGSILVTEQDENRILRLRPKKGMP